VARTPAFTLAGSRREGVLSAVWAGRAGRPARPGSPAGPAEYRAQKNEKPRKLEGLRGSWCDTRNTDGSVFSRDYSINSAFPSTEIAGTASVALVGSPGMDFLSYLSVGLPSECSACDCWLSSLSISSFTVAGWTTWLSQYTPSAVGFYATSEYPS
jgi:hypothetical protein